MKFPSPLVAGTLVQRYKRFLADVRLDSGEAVTATCPNTGSMKGLCDPGMRVWLSANDSPTRKYRYTWELVETDLGSGTHLVGINTSHPNAIASEAIAANRIAALVGYETQKREVKYGQSSRIDILLSDAQKGLCYVEIKNVHLMRKTGLAEFPDSKTERGVKHLQELAAMVREGHRAVMVYLIQRSDADTFTFASDIDPAYAAAFTDAMNNGVEALAVRCTMTTTGITVEEAVPIDPPDATTPTTMEKAKLKPRRKRTDQSRT